MSNKELYKNMPYKITRNIDLVDSNEKPAPEIREILNHTYEKVTRKKNSVVGELNELIKKYPHVPEFKNHLSSIYELQNNLTKAKEITRTIIKEHPDYLFGKLSIANEFMADVEFDKVPGVLGNLIDLKDLYPHRKVFHTNEVVMFNRTAFRYFIGIKDFDEAESRLEILYDLDSDEVYVERLTMQLAFLRLEEGMKRWKKEKEIERSVIAIAKKIAEPSNEKPLFNHFVIEQLYSNSLRINHEIIREILSLPRETLIADLHKVIYDSIIRFKLFSDDEEWNMDSNEFPTHAIFLLTELKSEESLEVILDILRQDEDYFEFWLGDYLNESIWECLYVLGFNRLNALKNFMMERDRYCFAREVISDVVSQIVFYHPERRSEVVQWYKEVFTFFVSQKENGRIIDTNLNGFMASDIIDIQAKELIPELTEIYNNQLASVSICGTLEQIISEIDFHSWSRNRKKELHENIFSKYNYSVAKRGYYNDDDDENESENEDGQWRYPDADFEKFDNEFDNDSNDSDVVYVGNPGTTYIKSEPKINRNDPCPCGSGKKYKKCHGNEGF